MQVSATDQDLTPGTSLIYSLASPPPPYFIIDSDSGNITLFKSLFYDDTTRYEFNVNAADPSRPLQLGTARVTVIVNRNRAGPVCVQDQYILTVSEYSPVPMAVGSGQPLPVDIFFQFILKPAFIGAINVRFYFSSG